MFRNALDREQVALIDFGVGDHGYKREWMTYSVPLYSMTAYNALSMTGLIGIAKMVWRKLTGASGPKPRMDDAQRAHSG